MALIIAAVVIAVMFVGVIFSMKKTKISNALLTEKFRSYQCRKCGGKIDIDLFAAPLNEVFYRLCNIENMDFVKLACEGCAFTDVYYHPVVMGEKPVWLEDIKAKEGFRCDKCAGESGRQISIGVTGIGLGRSLSLHSGEYKVDICDNCGYSEFYEILRPSGTPGGDKLTEEIGKLSREFGCGKCGGKGGSGCVVTATGGGLYSKVSNLQYVELIAVSCNKCKYCELYDRRIRAGENIFALR